LRDGEITQTDTQEATLERGCTIEVSDIVSESFVGMPFTLH